MPGPANSLNISEPGYVVFDGISVFTGNTLTAGTGITITNGTGISGNSTTISVTGGAAVTSVETANATPQFVLAGSTETVDFGITNLALGSTLPGLTSGRRNTCYGFEAGKDITSAISCTLIGDQTAFVLTQGASCVAIGSLALSQFTTGAASAGANIAIGVGNMANLLTGTNNISLGTAFGNALTGAESSNILIGASGTTGQSNSIHIGNQGVAAGQQDKAYMAGIAGTTVAGDLVTVSSTTGQLGRISGGATGTIIQGAGAGVSPTFSTATYPSTAAQGDLIYASATNVLSVLAKNASSTRYLSNTGASNAPAWAQIALTTGVTGVLPIANGGTNASSMTTSNGITKYDGTRLVTSTATIDSSNRYRNATQPCASVYLFNSVADVTGDGTVYTVIFDQTIFNVGSNFNIGTSVYTAPITGTYMFCFSCTVGDMSSSHTSAQLILDFAGGGSDINTAIFCNPYAIQSTEVGYTTIVMSYVGQMAATTTCTPKIYINGGTKTVDVIGAVSGRKTSYFTIAQIF